MRILRLTCMVLTLGIYTSKCEAMMKRVRPEVPEDEGRRAVTIPRGKGLPNKRTAFTDVNVQPGQLTYIQGTAGSTQQNLDKISTPIEPVIGDLDMEILYE